MGTANSGGKAGNDERIFLGQGDAVDSGFSDAEQAGDKGGQRHFLELLILGFQVDSQNRGSLDKGSRHGRGNDVVIADSRHAGQGQRGQTPVQAEDNKDLEHAAEDWHRPADH